MHSISMQSETSLSVILHSCIFLTQKTEKKFVRAPKYKALCCTTHVASHRHYGWLTGDVLSQLLPDINSTTKAIERSAGSHCVLVDLWNVHSTSSFYSQHHRHRHTRESSMSRVQPHIKVTGGKWQIIESIRCFDQVLIPSYQAIRSLWVLIRHLLALIRL